MFELHCLFQKLNSVEEALDVKRVGVFVDGVFFEAWESVRSNEVVFLRHEAPYSMQLLGFYLSAACRCI